MKKHLKPNSKQSITQFQTQIDRFMSFFVRKYFDVLSH